MRVHCRGWRRACTRQSHTALYSRSGHGVGEGGYRTTRSVAKEQCARVISCICLKGSKVYENSMHACVRACVRACVLACKRKICIYTGNVTISINLFPLS